MSTPACGASGPSSSRAGSPGSRRTSTKVMTEMTNSCGTSSSRRRATYFSVRMGGPPPHAGEGEEQPSPSGRGSGEGRRSIPQPHLGDLVVLGGKPLPAFELVAHRVHVERLGDPAERRRLVDAF